MINLYVHGQKTLGNLETSDKEYDTRLGKILHNVFHPNSNDSYVDDYYNDALAFEKIECKVPTQGINISEQQLVATTKYNGYRQD